MIYLFVGEKRSAKAVRMRVRWQDGRLAACGGFPPTSDKGMKGFADESLKLRDAVLEAEKNNANG
jgi:hypothetical protein